MSAVLVVDDDADIRDLVGELLRRAGHEVIEAPDGESGLKLFYAQRPGPRRAGRVDAGPRRLGGAQAHQGAERPAGADAHRARGGAREGARAARGRGRLRDEAVRAAGAARPRGRRAAARRRRAAGPGDLRRRLPDGGLRPAQGQRRRGRPHADSARVPAPRRLRPQPEPGAVPRPAARAGVGRRPLRRPRPGEALRRLPPPQARDRAGDASPIETVRGFGYRYRPLAPA